MANNKIETTLAAINGGQEIVILTGKSSGYNYEGGKRTGDTPTHTKIAVALQGNRLAALTVKIEGSADPLPGVSDEQIAAACSGVKLLAVKFTDCKVSIYSIGGQMVMSATASGVELVNAGK